MKIISYEYQTLTQKDLTFSKSSFQNRNLIVGVSGSGKSRFINTISNLGLMAVGSNKIISGGHWNITIKQNSTTYNWILTTNENREAEDIITSEKIYKVSSNGQKEKLICRNKDNFKFKDDSLPKLARDKTSIFILKDEEAIQPLYQGFSKIMQRRFTDDILTKTTQPIAISIDFLQKIEREKDLNILFKHGQLPLSAKLYILSQYFENIYAEICREFKAIFPFVTDLDLHDIYKFHNNFQIKIKGNIQSTDLGHIPVFALKENNIDEWIPLDQWSSGMQKVLLLITDILLLPTDGGVYLLDEYENSLGINAIHFLPSFLLDHGHNHQFFITSHHPYLINKIPLKNWFMFHRTGSNVTIEPGPELEQRFGQSSQESFIQLINDPLYIEGVV